jgi:hypothetical protein
MLQFQYIPLKIQRKGENEKSNRSYYLLMYMFGTLCRISGNAQINE